jgi:hypothetical protein
MQYDVAVPHHQANLVFRLAFDLALSTSLIADS